MAVPRNIFWKLKRLSLRTKVIIILLVILSVFGYRVSFSTRYHMVERHGQDMARDGIKVAQRYLNNQIKEFGNNLEMFGHIAEHEQLTPETFRHIYSETNKWEPTLRPDMFFYIEGSGTRLYSGNKDYSPEENQNVMKQVSSLQVVQAALAGQKAKGLELLPPDLLKYEGLIDEFSIKLDPIPNADSGRRNTELRGLAVVASYPVYVDGKFAGSLAAMKILNRTSDLVDMVSADIRLKSTIFLEDIRISTNIPDESQERAIGTLLSTEVKEIVINRGEPYFGRAFAVNEWYVTAYEPLHDLQNRVIGALYVGLEEAPLVDAQIALKNDIRLTVFILTLVVLATLFWLYNSIVEPVRKMASTALRFAAGEWDARIISDNLNRCFQINECDRTDCPVFGTYYIKCWLVPRATCYSLKAGITKEEGCRQCKVYKMTAGNEIDALTDSFNYMAAAIQEYTESLHNLNLELENKNFELIDQRDELECQKEQLEALNRRLEESMKALDDSQSIIYALAVAVEAKDPYTRGHSERVAEYSVKLAMSAGLDSALLEDLRGAALLHDIGKIGVSGAILRKPSTLTSIEFQQVKKHPTIGERICSSLKFARNMLPIIRHHHEHLNGKGYPDGYKGENIPFLARIVAVADAFDAMTSDRPYRPGMTRDQALSVLENGAGTQWDPELVRIFTSLMRKEMVNFKEKRIALEEEEKYNSLL